MGACQSNHSSYIIANNEFVDDIKLNSGILYQNILRVGHRILFGDEMGGYSEIR